MQNATIVDFTAKNTIAKCYTLLQNATLKIQAQKISWRFSRAKRKKNIFSNGIGSAFIYGIRKREFDMMNEVIIVSDCCGAEMTPIHAEHGLCPQCGEHCEADIQIWPIPE